MFRSAMSGVLLIMAFCTLPLSAQSSPSALASYFTGKEVVLKIDMPGTQQGVDLRFNKDNPMNWKEYSSRLKSNGVAIHKGDTARVTGVVVKDDRIEFQLDGGGFGTFLDDSSTTVAPKSVDKATTKNSWKERSPTLPMTTSGANCSATLTASGHGGSARRPTTATPHKSPARSRRKKSRPTA